MAAIYRQLHHRSNSGSLAMFAEMRRAGKITFRKP
jgi:hypothetical protein